jgi:hypothetical protein
MSAFFLLLTRETGEVAAKPTEGASCAAIDAPSVTTLRVAPPPPLRRGGV